jgi:hypothetical protein
MRGGAKRKAGGVVRRDEGGGEDKERGGCSGREGGREGGEGGMREGWSRGSGEKGLAGSGKVPLQVSSTQVTAHHKACLAPSSILLAWPGWVRWMPATWARTCPTNIQERLIHPLFVFSRDTGPNHRPTRSPTHVYHTHVPEGGEAPGPGPPGRRLLELEAAAVAVAASHFACHSAHLYSFSSSSSSSAGRRRLPVCVLSS